MNWVGKLLIEGLAFPSLNPMAQQGFTVESAGEFVSVSGGGLPRPLFLARIKDVAIVATSHAAGREWTKPTARATNSAPINWAVRT